MSNPSNTRSGGGWRTRTLVDENDEDAAAPHISRRRSSALKKQKALLTSKAKSQTTAAAGTRKKQSKQRKEVKQRKRPLRASAAAVKNMAEDSDSELEEEEKHQDWEEEEEQDKSKSGAGEDTESEKSHSEGTDAEAEKAGKKSRGADQAEEDTTSEQSQSTSAAKQKPVARCELYESIIRTGTSVKPIVTQWLDSFEEDARAALCEVANALLCSTGASSALTPESIAEQESNTLISNVCDAHAHAFRDADTAYPLVETLPVKASGPAKRTAAAKVRLKQNKKRLKKFSSRFREFFVKLVVAVTDRGMLADERLMNFLVDWLSEMARMRMRSFRHTASVASYAIMDALIKVCATSMHPQLDVALKNVEALQSRGAAAKAQARAQKTVDEFQSAIRSTHAFIQDLFESIFVHRYRDTSSNVRECSIQALGGWIITYPTFFAKDEYLKYVGWCLSDTEPRVRLAAVGVMCTLYSSAHIDKAALELFTQRFKVRFGEMTRDVDTAVAVKAIHVMTELLKTGALDEEDGKDIPLYIWDANEEIRVAAVSFVFEDSFAEEAAATATTEENAGQAAAASGDVEAKRRDDIVQMMNIFDTFILPRLETSSREHAVIAQSIGRARHGVSSEEERAAEQFSTALAEHMEQLVAGFWESLECLRAWPTMTRMLLVAGTRQEEAAIGDDVIPEELVQDLADEQRQRTLGALMLACAKRCALDVESKGDDAREPFIAMSQHFVVVLPRLITVYQADAPVIAALVRVSSLLDVDQFSKMRRMRSLRELGENFSKTFFLQASYAVLKEIARALASLCFSSNRQVSSEAESIYDEMCDSVIDRFSECSRAHAAKSSGVADDMEFDGGGASAAEMVLCIRRAVALVANRHCERLLFDDSEFDSALARALVLGEPDNELVAVLLDLEYYCTYSLTAAAHKEALRVATGSSRTSPKKTAKTKRKARTQVADDDSKAMSDDGEEAEEAESVSESAGGVGDRENYLAADACDRALETHSKLCENLDVVLRGKSFEPWVKDITLTIACDLMVLFTSRQNVLRAVHPLAVSVPLSLQESVAEHFEDVVSAAVKESERRGDEVGLQILERSLMPVARAVNFDGEKLPKLSGLLLSLYSFHGKDVDNTLKVVMKSLRDDDPSKLLRAQMAALQHVYNVGDEEKVRQLASRFVLTHALSRASDYFQLFLKWGIDFAMVNAPARFSFLPSALIPYVSRSTSASARAALSRLRVRASAARAAEELDHMDEQDANWDALGQFERVLTKKAGGQRIGEGRAHVRTSKRKKTVLRKRPLRLMESPTIGKAGIKRTRRVVSAATPSSVVDEEPPSDVFMSEGFAQPVSGEPDVDVDDEADARSAGSGFVVRPSQVVGTLRRRRR